MASKTFAEMCAERDPLYAAMQPVGAFAMALLLERCAIEARHPYLLRKARDKELFIIAIRALRNQGQPYYDAR